MFAKYVYTKQVIALLLPIVCGLSLLLGAVYFLEQNAMFRQEKLIMESLKLDAPQFLADEILPNFYLGSYPSILQYEKLKARGIKNILSIMNFVQIPPFDDRSQDFNFLFVKLEDIYYVNISEVFDVAHYFIDNALKKNESVLVHCRAGVSRSATIVISYIMRTHNLSYKEALDLVVERRSVVSPNPGFSNQLKDYEGNLRSNKSKQIREPTNYYLWSTIVDCKLGTCKYLTNDWIYDKFYDYSLYLDIQRRNLKRALEKRLGRDVEWI